MLPTVRSQVESQKERQKLANSYNELLKEFSSKDLHNVGNYAVGAFIGKGSFGKVYLARHSLIRRSKVVLKSTKKDDPNLAREIHHHRQFVHPHIARLYEVVATENNVWLVLEYCPGDELYHYLTRNGPLEVAKTQKIFTQLVGAVSYVHNKSCVHRDLKLENILLDKNENVKLVDFGFTREYEGKYSYLQTWCGTVCYSAPEMLRGEKYAAEKVDVWSLGIILYALLLGELPFDEDDETATKARILKEEPKYPGTIPAQAKDLITLLLSKRPLLRPSLADILTNQWLSEHAPAQQAILKLQQPAPFSTKLETDVLERMRRAGVDIDAVIESVLSQRCDTLAGWWSLLLEKEEQKERRRQRRRKDKEAEAKVSRRISSASARLIAPTINESDEERFGESNQTTLEEVRGRALARLEAVAIPPITSRPTTAGRAEQATTTITSESTNESALLRSSLDQRVNRTHHSINSNEGTAKRNNMVYGATSSSSHTNLQDPQDGRLLNSPRHKLGRFATLKRWFARRGKHSGSPGASAQTHHNTLRKRSRNDLQRMSVDASFRRAGNYPERGSNAAFAPRPRVVTNTTTGTAGSSRRMSSHSPSPLTPSSSYRRSGASAANLRGRKSTSSSISSMRSLHVRHTSHSKASSISSSSVGSPSSPLSKQLPSSNRRRNSKISVKIIPSQLSGPPSPFPANTRVLKGPASLTLPNSQNAFTGLGPPSPGLTFAKRRRSPFKGPAVSPGRRKSDGTGQGVRTVRRGSVPGEASGPVTIEEEDEDETDEYIEEVDVFLPPDPRLGEYIEDEQGPEDDTELPHSPPLTKWEVEG